MYFWYAAGQNKKLDAHFFTVSENSKAVDDLFVFT